MTQRLKSHYRTYRISPNPQCSALEPEENSVRQQQEKIEKLPEDLQLTNACDDAFKGNVSPRQFSVTNHDIHLMPSIFEYQIRTEKMIRGNTRIGPLLDVNITEHSDRHGIEIKIDSTQKDGTKSWKVISKDIGKYVTELSEGNKEPVLYEEA